MRDIVIGEEHCAIHGSLQTLFIYRAEFTRPGEKRADLMSDFFGVIVEAAKAGIDFNNLEEVDLEKVDMAAFFGIFTTLVQVTWAMCKTAHAGERFPSFNEWLKTHEEADLMEIMVPVMEEAQRAFFRNPQITLKAQSAS